MILTNTAVKKDFYLIRHFDIKMSPASRCLRHQDGRVKLSGVKSVASSCPASKSYQMNIVYQWRRDKKTLWAIGLRVNLKNSTEKAYKNSYTDGRNVWQCREITSKKKY